MWGGVCGQGCKDLSLPCGHLKGTGTGHRLHVAGTAGKQRAPEHGIRGGGARPWDGHSSSFLSRNQQAGWGARKAFQPAGKLMINSHGPGDVPGGTCHLWPAAACHHCAAASCWAAGWGTRRSRPACGPARTALARRRPHVGARSPQHPGSSSRLPSLSACQPTFPTRFLPLSFFCIFFFFFFFPLSQSLCREGEGVRAANGQQEETGEGESSAWKAVGAHPTATAASREVTSFPPRALCFSPQRRRGQSSQQLLCLRLPLSPAAQSRGVLLSATPSSPFLSWVPRAGWWPSGLVFLAQALG